MIEKRTNIDTYNTYNAAINETNSYGAAKQDRVAARKLISACPNSARR